jgi:hypothetical protein
LNSNQFTAACIRCLHGLPATGPPHSSRHTARPTTPCPSPPCGAPSQDPSPLVLSLLGPNRVTDAPTAPLLYSHRPMPSEAGYRLPSTSRSRSPPSLSGLRSYRCRHCRLTMSSMLQLFLPFFFCSSLLALPLRWSISCHRPLLSTRVCRRLQALPRRTGAPPSHCTASLVSSRTTTLPGVSATQRRCSLR